MTRSRAGSGMLTVFSLVVITILLLLGTSLAFQNQGVRTDSRAVIGRLLAQNGARNAVEESIPYFLSRVNQHQMTLRIPASRALPSSGGQRLAELAGADEEGYRRFMSEFDHAPKIAMDTLAGEVPGEAPKISYSGDEMVIEVPEDPFYREFRANPGGFEGEMAVAVSQRIYAPYGDRARFPKFKVQCLGAKSEADGRVHGLIAFTGECSMTTDRLTVHRALQVRQRFVLESPDKDGHSLVRIDPVRLGEVVVAPAAEQAK